MLPDSECTVLRSLFTPGSRKFWALRTDQARLLYVAILKNRDAKGRVEGRASDLQGLVPRSGWSLRSIQGYIRDMERVALIRTLEGGQYLEVVWSQNGATATNCDRDQLRPNATDQQIQEDSSRNQSQLVAAQKPSVVSSCSSLTTTNNKQQNNNAADDPDEVFRRARRAFRNHVGKSIGSRGRREGQWCGLVLRHGGDIVVCAVDLWAKELGKAEGRKLRYPLGVFLDYAAEEFLEAATTKAQWENSEHQNEEEGGLPVLEPRY